MRLFLFFLLVLTQHISAQKFSTFTDREDGRTYKIVEIGKQWWFAENLKYEAPEGSYCYDNDTLNCTKYGRLYKWELARRVCPRGWHLPTKEEFDDMLEVLDNQINTTYSHLIAGGSSGFEALLSGRLRNNYFEEINQTTFFWTNSQDLFGNIWFLNLLKVNENAFFYFTKEDMALPVRCVRNVWP